ncbi:hypothetical protein [Streptomyces sp. NBC_01429]|uniref:hypothetical protein n=1 Tax=Streptomyces sp. NBC_01429 TaxID=2903862 RepID=UPI002E2BB4BB|nr:hypothetical protein [Streptomyces sp. NBC_01429]
MTYEAKSEPRKTVASTEAGTTEAEAEAGKGTGTGTDGTRSTALGGSGSGGTGGGGGGQEPGDATRVIGKRDAADPVKPFRTAEAARPGRVADAGDIADAGTNAVGGDSASTAQPHTDSSARLIPQGESDRLAERLQNALSTFVDGPRHSVEEAADVLEEAAGQLTKALADRPRSLRAGWDGPGDGAGNGAADGSHTEELRLALQSYREMTERLLRV